MFRPRRCAREPARALLRGRRPDDRRAARQLPAGVHARRPDPRRDDDRRAARRARRPRPRLGVSDESRVLIVSNRLPVTSRARRRRARASSRARAASRRDCAGPHGERREPVDRLAGPDVAARRRAARGARRAPRRAAARADPPLRGRVRRYYEGFSNGVLWPLFHYLLDQVPLDARRLGRLRARQRALRRRVSRECAAPGDSVWVHDYQLMLVPQTAARAPARARASGSSSTSRFPRRRCSARCRAASRSCAACSAPT